MQKTINLYGMIGREIKAIDFVAMLSDYEKQGVRELVMHINSEGGNVIDGNVMFNALQRTTIRTKAIIDGISASMMSIIILACDEVDICENAFIMIHRPMGASGGNADEIKSSVKILEDMEINFAKAISSKTGLNTEKVKKDWLSGGDHWFNSQEAITYGLANRIVQSKATDIKVLRTKDLNANTLYSQFTASLTNKSNIDMKQKLIDVFSLTDVSSSNADDEIIAKLKEKFDQLEKQAGENSDTSIEAMLNSAIKDKKIAAINTDTYRQIGKTSGIKALATILDERSSIAPTGFINAMIQDTNAQHDERAKPKDKNDWKLEDYRRHAPQELKSNPNLYAQLCKNEFGK